MHPLVHYTQTIESSHTHLHSQSLTPGPNQSQENIFNSGSSCGDTSNMSSAPSNVGVDIPSQGSFDIGVRGFGGLSHQGFRLEQSAFLVKKIVSREGLDDERRCHAHEYHAVCLSHTLVQEFHMLPRPNVISGGILSTVALQRRIAQPLASKKNKKGADTGFWDSLDMEMRKLVKHNGPERKDPRWVEWEEDIIASDRTKFVEDREISSDEDVVEEDGDGDLPPDTE
ncbi:hypothetical protein HWV62_17860 [Athelia sp. TMB]|nr:hypothetical protein HWV62_17860 [Athelia sp. TMB]